MEVSAEMFKEMIERMARGDQEPGDRRAAPRLCWPSWAPSSSQLPDSSPPSRSGGQHGGSRIASRTRPRAEPGSLRSISREIRSWS